MASQSEREGLLDAIRSAPDDDTPRLVYTDWLDEHGEPERAAFIRAQVAEARAERELEELGVLQPRLLLPSPRQSERLFKAHRAKIQGGLPTGQPCPIEFRRGFPEIAFPRTAQAFLKWADALCAGPLRRLNLVNVSPRELATIVRRGYLRRVEELLFAAHPRTSPDETLQMLAALTWAPDVASLRHLILMFPTGAPIDTRQAIEAITRAPQSSRLAELSFWVDSGFDASALELLAGRLPQLQGLQFTTPGLSATVASVLGNRFPNLTKLYLDGHGLDSAGAFALAAAPNLRQLKHLRCYGRDNMGAEAVAALLASSAFPALRSLSLNGASGPLGPALRAIRHLRGPTLRSLDLTRALLGADGALALTELGPFQELVWLALTNCGLGPGGLTALARWPRLASLRHLGFAHDHLDLEGTTALAESPYIEGLSSLIVSDVNSADRAALQPLRRRLGRKGWKGNHFLRPS
jgi:uncharacterized protein (TIGR02996 family)